VEKMGYYKNLEVALQEIHGPELREIVAWDRAHRDLLSDEARWQIMTNEVSMERHLAVWRSDSLPVPASAHVALHVKRGDLRKQEKANRLITVLLYIAIVMIAGAIVVAVWL
tara:strand:+ start:9297 stop:9632 length:336 start_codon:yes stop_codon:yes gene_type:complete